MKFFAFSLLTLIALSPLQKSMAQTDKKQPAAVLNHIAVYVADLKTATDFYENIFSLPQIPEPFHDGRHTWFSLGSAGHLHIIQGAKKNEIHDKNEHLCFSVVSIDDFIKKLKAKNIEFESWVGVKGEFTLRVDGIKQIYFKDPDGHWLEVNNDR
ncbi:VOC family protein [Pedobacter aquatilis]|uniref:VOC family protein n=1 Tax=Pedobacter aquatilis TaxID=351343 RepID=UPI00292F427D|nr:VOC family protein [Pedobacter aquatilis]